MSQGLIENLLAEAIGIVLTVLFVTMMGRRIARHWHSERWREYRSIVASQIEQENKALSDNIRYFGAYVGEIAEKPIGELSDFDHAQIVEKYRTMLSNLDRVRRLFEAHHFCLREKDIQAISKYITHVSSTVGTKLDETRIDWLNFESMLETHLRGVYPLTKALGGGFDTRHDMFTYSASQLQQKLENFDHVQLRVKSSGTADVLRSG